MMNNGIDMVFEEDAMEVIPLSSDNMINTYDFDSLFSFDYDGPDNYSDVKEYESDAEIDDAFLRFSYYNNE